MWTCSLPMTPAIDDRLTIDPPPLATIAGIAYLMPKNTPVAFTPVLGERFLERVDTKLGAKRVRQSPRQHRTAHPVHDHYQIEKAFGHRDVGDVRAPHLIDPLDRDPTKQIRVDLVRRCRFAGVWSLVDRHQPHQPH